MNYEFEYCFIPKVLGNINSDDFFSSDASVFDNFENLQTAFELEYECVGKNSFDWDNLAITKYISKQLSYWFFKFPPKKDEVDAVYGMIVQYAEKAPVYFTFENYAGGGKFVFGMKTITAHRNFGTMGFLDENGFKELVLEKIKRCPELLDPAKNEMAPLDPVIDEKDILTF